jgi:hypothetical protein
MTTAHTPHSMRLFPCGTMLAEAAAHAGALNMPHGMPRLFVPGHDRPKVQTLLTTRATSAPVRRRTTRGDVPSPEMPIVADLVQLHRKSACITPPQLAHCSPRGSAAVPEAKRPHQPPPSGAYAAVNASRFTAHTRGRPELRSAAALGISRFLRKRQVRVLLSAC